MRIETATLECAGIVRSRSLVVVVRALAIVAATAGCAWQSDKVPRVGFISSAPGAISDVLKDGLQALGRAEGRNIVVDW